MTTGLQGCEAMLQPGHSVSIRHVHLHKKLCARSQHELLPDVLPTWRQITL